MAADDTGALQRSLIARGKTLLTKIDTWRNIRGSSKLHKKVAAELRFLQTVNVDRLQIHNVLKSSNLISLEAIASWADELPGTIGVLQSFIYHDTCTQATALKKTLVVDVVCRNGGCLVKVVARQPQALYLAWKGEERFGKKSIVDQACQYKLVAESNPCNFQSPRILFIFCHGVTAPMVRALEEMNVFVEGRIEEVSERTKKSCRSDDDETDDGVSQESDVGSTTSAMNTSEDCTESNLANSVTSCNRQTTRHVPHVALCLNTVRHLSRDSTPVGGTTSSLQEGSEDPSNARPDSASLKVDSTILDMSSFKTDSIYMPGGATCPPSSNVTILPEHISFDAEKCCLVGSTAKAVMSTMQNIVIADIPLKKEQQTHHIHAQTNTTPSEHCTDRGENCHHQNNLNLDITAMIALVSSLCHGRSNFVFKEAVLNEQAQAECRRPILPELLHYLQGKCLYACETALTDFGGLVGLLGGPSEKRRASYLLQQVKQIPDAPSDRVQGLLISTAIKVRSKIIFGTGDRYKMATVSANGGFVRAARSQGVELVVHHHRPRALTEQKEHSAMPI